MLVDGRDDQRKEATKPSTVWISQRMTLLTPQSLIVIVFVATTYLLLLSIQHTLFHGSEPGEVKLWQRHIESYAVNGTGYEDLLADGQRALQLVLRSEIAMFLAVQWSFSAFAVFAVATIVSMACSCASMHARAVCV